MHVSRQIKTLIQIGGDTANVKCCGFYEKMIEDVERHENTTFTKDEQEVDAAMRYPYFEPIGDAYEIRKGKQKISL